MNKTLEIEPGTVYISASQLGSFDGFTRVIIPDSVTLIDDGAFRHINPEEIVYGNGIKRIDTEANGCDNLKRVKIPDSVVGIMEYAFAGCHRLENVTIGANVEYIGQNAFLGCNNLVELSVSNKNKVYHSKNNCLIETNDRKLLFGCTNSVIPADESVTKIGDSAFAYRFNSDSKIQEIKIPGNIKIIGRGSFFGCSGLTSVTISEGVVCIGKESFAECTKLTDIIIPNSVTTILGNAFLETKLKTRVRNYIAFGTRSDNSVHCRNLNKTGVVVYSNLFEVFNDYCGVLNKDVFIYVCEVGDKPDENKTNKFVTKDIKSAKMLSRQGIIDVLNGA